MAGVAVNSVNGWTLITIPVTGCKVLAVAGMADMAGYVLKWLEMEGNGW